MRRDAEQNRQKIIAAADRLISEQGLGVGHDQIARAAGVAVGTVYRRFPDKSALVAALFTEQVETVVDAARAALLVEDAWQAIVEFLTAILKMQADSRGLRELVSGSPHAQDLTRYARAQIGPVVRELVARGHDAGVLRADIAEQDIALIPIMIGSIIHTARTVDPELWRRTLAVVLDGLRAGHRDPLPGSAPTSEQLTLIISS
jgi:AcrR family transcriptional regulator